MTKTYLNANRRLGHVEHNTGPAVKVLVRHTAVDGTIDLDVDDVSHTVRGEVLGQTVLHTFLAERFGEHIARTRALTERVRHLF